MQFLFKNDSKITLHKACIKYIKIKIRYKQFFWHTYMGDLYQSAININVSVIYEQGLIL